MGFLSKMFRKTFADRKTRGDRHFDEGAYGLARAEFEEALSLFDPKVDDADARAAIEERLGISRAHLGRQHLEEAMSWEASGRLDEAEDAGRFAADMLPEGEEREKAIRLLDRIEDRRDGRARAADRTLTDDDLDTLEAVEAGTFDEEVEEELPLDELLEQNLLALTLERGRDYRALGPAFARGFVLLNEGQGDEAVDYLRQAAEEHADSRWVHLELGRALLFTGEGDEAAEHLARYREAAPDDPDAAFALAEALRIATRDDEALAVMNAEIEARPASVRARLAVAEHHLALEQWDAATEAANAALALFDEATSGRRNLTSWARTASAEDAVAESARGAEAEDRLPPRIHLFRTLGSAHFGAGRYEEAIAPLEKALKEHWRYDQESGHIEFDHESAWLLTAIYTQLGRKRDRAIDLLHALAREVDSGSRGAIFARIGELFSQQGKKKEALEMLERGRALLGDKEETLATIDALVAKIESS